MMKIAIVVVTILVINSSLNVEKIEGATSSSSNDECLGNISQNCNADDGVVTSLDVTHCCIALKLAINQQRECFCQLKPYLTDATSSDNIAALFLTCTIQGTFDTLCPATSTSTEDNNDDVSGNGGTGGNDNGSTLGDKKNVGNKMRSLSIWSMLIIILISLTITRAV